jgi:biopolymer transport protein ExbD
MRLSSSHKSRKTELELSSTSMIDIVFLLLIFFLVTSSFVKAEREYRPAIQVNEKSAASKQSDLEKAIVEIVLVGGEYQFQIGTVQTTDDDQLTKILETFGNKSQGAFVRAPDAAPFDLSARAVAACKDAGFDAVTYVPMEKSK